MSKASRLAAFVAAQQKLTIDIQALETEASRLGLYITMHALNNAKNAAGWELAGELELAASASKGIRPGEPVRETLDALVLDIDWSGK